MDPSPHSQTQIGDLQKSYGTNWSKENIRTIFEWLTIASFNIICLDLVSKYYKRIIRNSIILGLIFSTVSGTVSVSELVARFNISCSEPIVSYILNGFFIALTFAIATCTGYIKVYQIQENLESAIQYKQEWIIFSSAIASELQLPVELRKDAVWMIIKNKNKYLDLLKFETDIPEFIRKKAFAELSSKNIMKLDVSSLTHIMMEIGSHEYENIMKGIHTPIQDIPNHEKHTTDIQSKESKKHEVKIENITLVVPSE
jgi:hypothetical protein